MRFSGYVVQARFVGPIPAGYAISMEGNIAYLGTFGQWGSLEKAREFESRATAETALEEKWLRMWNEGVKSVVLSVVEQTADSRPIESQ